MSRLGRFFCRLGIHDERRSQGVVGLCGRGCGDLKCVHDGGLIWTRYIDPDIKIDGVGGLPPPPPPFPGCGDIARPRPIEVHIYHHGEKR
jgi:hypothetical protein